MIRKLLKRNSLVELDNIVNNITVLAECFIASEVLNTQSEIMKEYKENGKPLSLNITHYTLEGDDIKKKGVISDKEGREIAVMEIAFRAGRISMYAIDIKGRLKGKKVKIKKCVENKVIGKHCSMVDLTNTLNHAVDIIQ